MDRRLTENFNWSLFGVTMALVLIGLVNIYSAVYYWGEGGSLSLFWSQLIWTCVGLVLFGLVSIVDYRIFYRAAIPTYVVVCALLLVAVLVGRAVRGTQGWIHMGPFSLQPTEFAKLAFILVSARFFADNPNPDGYGLLDLWKPTLLMAVPFSLVLLQGAMGSSLFFILIFVSMSLFAKVKTRTLIVCALVGVVAAAGVYSFGLKDYQRSRIMTFMHPETDIRGSGYHLMQSKIAVGSGMLFGKGYLKGNINKLRYLPERHTDFIFPVFAEEWGFVGCLIVMGLYTALLMMGVEVGAHARDRFGAFAAIGIVSLLFWQMTINLGGVLGIIPLTGVTLPLMSYGGSSMIAILASLGLLFSIHVRRFMF